MVQETPVCASTKISEEEAAVYDRQIRLWGVEAQNKLRNSNVMIIGMPGIGAETAKNLVLAGIKSLTMLDSQKVGDCPNLAQFLIPTTESANKDRAQAALPRLAELNTMVDVSAKTSLTSDISKADLDQIDIICAFNQGKDDLIYINNLCREAGKKFCCASVWGSLGYFFLDFIEHSFVEEKQSVAVEFENVDDSKELEACPSKKARHEVDVTDDTPQLIKQTEHYSRFEEDFGVDWATKTYAPKVKRLPPAVFLVQILYLFNKEFSRFPQREKKADDIAALQRIKEEMFERFRLSGKLEITESMLSDVFGEMCAVNAVVGGVLSQEIIKALSGKDRTLNNHFYFHPCLDSNGTVLKIPF